MSAKEYKTYEQLISILKSRGVNIAKEDESRIIEILKKENYYNVINGYKALFLEKTSMNENDEQYKNGTTFDEIYALYNFDRELRSIYMKYLLIIENTLKTVIAHSFSENYGDDNYLKLESFDCSPYTNRRKKQEIAKKYKLDICKDEDKINQISIGERIEEVTKLIGDIHKEISRQMSNHHNVVTHYMTKYGGIPLWVLVNVLTFGKITSFYFNLKEKDKIKIAKNFHIDYIELHKYMTILGLSRNKCAHDERFFDSKFKSNIRFNSIKNISILSLNRDEKGSYLSGKNDIFAVAIIFSQMLKKSDMDKFVSLINVNFQKLKSQIKTIDIGKVMNAMGYPENWYKIIKLVR